MIKHLCDRCGADVTDKQSASVRIVGDADKQGNGTVTDTADLCVRCRRAFLAWLHTRPATPGHHR